VEHATDGEHERHDDRTCDGEDDHAPRHLTRPRHLPQEAERLIPRHHRAQLSARLQVVDLGLLLLDDDVRRAVHDREIVRALLEACILVCAGDLEVSDVELKAIGTQFAQITNVLSESDIRRVLTDVKTTIERAGWQPMLDRIQAMIVHPDLRKMAVALATACAAADGLVDDEVKLAYGLGRTLGLTYDDILALVGRREPEDDEPEKAGWFRALFGEPPKGDALEALADAGALGAGRPSSFVVRTLIELGVKDAEGSVALSLARLAKLGSPGMLEKLERRLKDARLRNAAYTFAFGAVTAAGGKPAVASNLASAFGIGPVESRRLALAFMSYPEGRWTGAPQLDAKSAKRALPLACLAAYQLEDKQLAWLRWLFPRIGAPEPDDGTMRKAHRSIHRDVALSTLPRVAAPLVRELDAAGRRAAFVALFGVALLGSATDHGRAVELAPLTGVPSEEWVTLVERWVLSSGMHTRAMLGDGLVRLLSW
jgi:tellurite resistance protein